MNIDVSTGKKVTTNNGNLGLDIKVTLHLRADDKEDSEEILALLKSMPGDQEYVVWSSFIKYLKQSLHGKQ